MASTVVTGTERLVAPAIDWQLVLGLVGVFACCLTAFVLALQAPPVTNITLPICR